MPSVYTENRKNRRMKDKLQRRKDLNKALTVADAVMGIIPTQKEFENEIS